MRSPNHLELIIHEKGRVPVLSGFVRNDGQYLMIHSGKEEVGLLKIGSTLTGMKLGLTFNTEIEFIYYLLLAVISAFHYTVIKKADKESTNNY